MDPREAPTLRHLPPLVGDDDDSVPELSPFSIDPDDVLPQSPRHQGRAVLVAAVALVACGALTALVVAVIH